MKLKELALRIGNLKTTVIGIVTLLVSVLVGLNVIGPDAGQELSTGIDLLYSNVVELMTGLAGIILIFSKDSLVESPAE